MRQSEYVRPPSTCLSEHTCHLAKLRSHIRVSLHELHLRLGSLGGTLSATACHKRSIDPYILVSERVDKLRLAPRELRLLVEHAHRNINLTLLHAELGEGRDGSLALGIDFERLLTALLRFTQC